MKTGTFHLGLASTFLLTLTSCSPTPGSSQADLEAYHASISKDFIDPSGTMFRNEFIAYPDDYEAGDRFSLCGEINIKNEFGGYVGFRSFVYDPTLEIGALILGGDSESPVSKEIHDDLCNREKESISVIEL